MDKKYEGFSASELVISVKADQLGEFFQLLQQGVILRTEVGCSVRSFLYHQLELSPEFVEDCIQTIFLDGKPVDDLDAASVKDGCTLALSSAMPGLVGATMRRGGFYASLRSQISHGPEAQIAPVEAEGSVTLKLFNLVAQQLGKALLQNGIYIKSESLEDLLSRQPDLGLKGIRAIRDGMPLDRDTFRTSICADKLVYVRFEIRQE